MKVLILTPIAERDVHFYLATADKITQQRSSPEMEIVFVSFFQPGNDLIRQRGYKVYDPYAVLNAEGFRALSRTEAEKKFQTPSLEALSQHENLTFGISHMQKCIEKFERYLPALDQLLAQIETDFAGREKFIAQELAGFIGPLSLFYVGMARGWTHYFTEPAFFKGRIHLLKNNLFFQVAATRPQAESEKQVQHYLREAFQKKTVVAARKDAHHYKDMGFSKVFNQENFRKLGKKLAAKYVNRNQQELDHISNHVQRYLKMLLNRWKNQSSYVSLESLKGKKMVYFPFHVQLDFSLTIRSPQWLDQLALIEKVLLHLPKGSLLVAKEHPASIGCLAQNRLEKLLENPQFKLLHPLTNSYDILSQSSGVVTINSKVGAEALSQGIPTLTFGKAFYTERGFAPHFQDWAQVEALLQKWLGSEASARVPNPEWILFLAQVWEQSFETELYDLTESNVASFARTLTTVL
ncbi:MAG: hypothetical protein ACAH59_11955 [Pseudobdellovibrionaceae bacterium]